MANRRSRVATAALTVAALGVAGYALDDNVSVVSDRSLSVPDRNMHFPQRMW